jgi:hypothetical protein
VVGIKVGTRRASYIAGVGFPSGFLFFKSDYAAKERLNHQPQAFRRRRVELENGTTQAICMKKFAN